MLNKGKKPSPTKKPTSIKKYHFDKNGSPIRSSICCHLDNSQCKTHLKNNSPLFSTNFSLFQANPPPISRVSSNISWSDFLKSDAMKHLDTNHQHYLKETPSF